MGAITDNTCSALVTDANKMLQRLRRAEAWMNKNKTFFLDLPEMGVDVDVDGLAELDSLWNNCDFLNGAFDNPNDLLQYSNSWSVGDRISKEIEGFGLDTLVPDLDKLLTCLSSICAIDVDNMIAQMSGYMTNLHLDPNGQFSLDGIDEWLQLPSI